MIVVALIIIVSSFGRGSGGAASGRAFFTNDDGKTWFVDEATRLPPFESGGKQAVRAYVFQAGGTKFVNHLERLTADGKKSAEAAAKGAAPPRPAPPSSGGPPAPVVLSEVKRPGDAAWTPTNDMTKAAPVMSPKPPAGVSGDVVPVEP